MPKPKKIMKEFSIFEISGVDDPAQAGATMSIMKSKSSKSPESPAPVKKKEAHMPKTAEELQAELNKMAKERDDANTEVEKAKAEAKKAAALAELTDAEKAYYKGLSDGDKDKFLKSSAEDRQKEVEAEAVNKAAQNPVVYKASDGTEYFKNDDKRLIEMAKRDDAREEDMKKMREDAANTAFEKSASVDFAKFKGEMSVKTALAKAIAGIKDETLRDGVKEMLKAAHSAVSLTLKEVGGLNDDYSLDDADGDKLGKAKAEKQLDELAKKHAADQKVDYSKAYSAVLETSEGQKLYAQTV